VIQKGGVITVENARLRQQEKAEKEKAAAIKRAQKHIQTAVNKAKAALNYRSISARKAEKQRKQLVKEMQSKGEIIPAEMLIPIPDPEKHPSPEDLESLQPPLDLLQALLILEPIASTNSGTIDPQLLTLDSQIPDIEIYTTREGAEARYGLGNTIIVDDRENCAEESDSDSSSISADSIMRNANFVSID